MLTRQEADRELELAEKMNPGAWIDHSRATGQNAELIAKAGNGCGEGILHGSAA